MVKLLPFALFYTKLILFCLIDQVNRVGEPIQCHNGTWTQIPRCVPARCKTMPTPPQNGMIVAPSLNHGASGLYHCKVLSIVFDAARIKSLLHLHSLPRLDFFCLPVTQTTSLKSCKSRNQKHTILGWIPTERRLEDYLCVWKLDWIHTFMWGNLLSLPWIPGQWKSELFLFFTQTVIFSLIRFSWLGTWVSMITDPMWGRSPTTDKSSLIVTKAGDWLWEVQREQHA